MLPNERIPRIILSFFPQRVQYPHQVVVLFHPIFDIFGIENTKNSSYMILLFHRLLPTYASIH